MHDGTLVIIIITTIIINIAAAGAVDRKLLDIGRARARARGRAGGRALAILRAGPGRERPGSKSQRLLIKIL